jgi:hypothetical protein
MAQLSEFVGALRDGGARANQFEVNITGGPSSILTSNQDFKFLCKSTQVPALTMGEVAVPYRGRQIYIAGDRTYETWAITVISDRGMFMRSAFEQWQSFLGDIGGTTNRSSIGDTPSQYYGTALIKQKDRNDATLRTYRLFDVWPTSVDAMEFAYETEGLMEFGVTFRFNHMTIDGSPSGTLGTGGGGTGGTTGGPR